MTWTSSGSLVATTLAYALLTHHEHHRDREHREGRVAGDQALDRPIESGDTARCMPPSAAVVTVR
jgi:hypothetical protein